MNNIKNIKALYRSPRTSIVGSGEATLTSKVRQFAFANPTPSQAASAVGAFSKL